METVWNALMENWVELLEWPAMAVTVLAAWCIGSHALGGAKGVLLRSLRVDQKLDERRGAG